MIRSISAAVLAFALGTALRADEPLKHTADTPDEVKKNLREKKAVLIDVRSVGERNDDGYLKDSISMPIDGMKKKIDEAKLKELAKDKIVYTHCAAGGRALKAGEMLKKLGYDVRPLKPGYADLVELGFEKAPAKKEEKE